MAWRFHFPIRKYDFNNHVRYQWHGIGINISEQKSGTERTKKRELVLFTPPGCANCTLVHRLDIVISSESKEQVEEKLESWRYSLERRGMKVNRRKTEYMCVNERQDTGSGTVKMQGEEVAKVDDFKYLGSTVQSNGECGREVKKRVQAGWNGWRRMSGVICDRRVPARVKGKVYKVAVRPAMLYGLETVALTKRQEAEMEVAELSTSEGQHRW